MPYGQPHYRRGGEEVLATGQAEVDNTKEAERELGGGGAATDAKSEGGFGFSVSPGSGEIVKVGSDAEVKAGQKASLLVVVFGNATLDGEVDGDMVVVAGDATVNGTVRGDFVNVLGTTKLGPKAELMHDCVVVGGALDRDPSAKLSHQPVEVNFGAIAGVFRPFVNWFRSGLFLGRLLPPSSGLAWTFVGLHFLIYLVVLLLLPKPVAACTRTLEGQALLAFCVGLLVLVLLVPLLAILVASGIGLLVVPFLWLATVAAGWVGKTAVLDFLGAQVLSRAGLGGGPASLRTFVVGAALVTVLYMVPILGLVLWGVLQPLALGAAVMAAVASIRSSSNGHRGGLLPPGTPGSPGPPSTELSHVVASAPGEPTVNGGGDPYATSAAVVAGLPRAGFWIRFGATCLDFLLVFWLIPMVGTFFIPAWIGYHIGMWTWKQTTIGGIICGLKVVRLDGRPVDVGVATVRSLASGLSFFALGLGFFWVGWVADRQAWHDRIAGTTLVRMPRGVSLL